LARAERVKDATAPATRGDRCWRLNITTTLNTTPRGQFNIKQPITPSPPWMDIVKEIKKTQKKRTSPYKDGFVTKAKKKQIVKNKYEKKMF
jgi:hypothetical protein